MKILVFYSSLTGNTEKMAGELACRLRVMGECELRDISSCEVDTDGVDIVLLGGWAEGGRLNKAALEMLEKLDLQKKRLGLFMTMGAHPESEHGRACREFLNKLVMPYDNIGVQILRGSVSKKLMEKIDLLPESVLPASVKEGMKAGVADYTPPTESDYQSVADYFINKI